MKFDHEKIHQLKAKAVEVYLWSQIVFGRFKVVFPRIARLVLMNLNVFRNRVLLTIIGILFGTVAVISTFTVNNNLSRMADEELKKVGNDVISLTPKAPATEIDLPSIRALNRFCPAVSEVAAFLSFESNISSMDKYTNVTSFGVDFAYLRLKKLGIRMGRDFSRYDANSRVVILGATVAEEHFKKSNPIGKVMKLKVGGLFIPFRVVGVVSPQPELKMISAHGTPDSSVYIPFSIAYQRLGIHKGTGVMIRARSSDDLASARRQALAELKSKYAGKLELYDPHDEVAKARSLTNGILYSGLAIGILSLFSGGVGIMNIMLISVVQRRKEIGLYKAIGFQDQIILIEFLAEAFTISLLGVLVGTLIGAPVSSLMSRAIVKGYGEVSLFSIVLSWVFSLAVGLSFGYLPAKQASELDPVEALKS
jgi:ABC-type antimicrobial peptide transport system permease subunit